MTWKNLGSCARTSHQQDACTHPPLMTHHFATRWMPPVRVVQYTCVASTARSGAAVHPVDARVVDDERLGDRLPRRDRLRRRTGRTAGSRASSRSRPDCGRRSGPSRARWAPLQLALAVLTLTTGPLGFVCGVIVTTQHLDELPAERVTLIGAVGLGESLHNVGLALVLMMLVGLLTSVGALRLTRAPA